MILILLAAMLLLDEAPHRLEVGAFYYPTADPGTDLPRMAKGDPGGREAFNRVLVAIAHLQEGRPPRLVWTECLAALASEGGRMRAVLDAHVLCGDEWIRDRDGEGRTKVFRLVREVEASPHADRVAGWYVCDEPFGKSRKGQLMRVDMRRIWDLANEIRSASKRARIYADYQGSQPALRKDGDPVNGGRDHYTRKREDREGFHWDGVWVESVQDRAYAGGKRLHRGLGFFGEDVSLVNWGGDAKSLATWLPYMLCDVPAERLEIVGNYDWTEDNEEGNAFGVNRFRQIVEVGLKEKLGGFWVWAWQDFDVQGRTYKGCGGWWERAPGKEGGRWAAAIEAIP